MKKIIKFARYILIMMKKYRNTSFILPMIVVVCVTLFLALFCPHHLHFQEQEQLFLYDIGYCADILSVPGGFSDLLGRFFTQFFIYAWLGAAIIAVLSVIILMQLQQLRMLLALSNTRNWSDGLLLIPSGLLVAFVCDEHALVGTFFALILSLLYTYIIIVTKRVRLACLLALAGSVVMYWLAGPLAVIGILLSAFGLMRKERSMTVHASVFFSLALFAIMPLWARQLVSVDMSRLFFGVHYYRVLVIHPLLPWLAALSAVIAVLAGFWQKADNRKQAVMSNVIVILLLSLSIWQFSYNPKAEKVLAYDFMARCRQWDKIIETADKEAPNNAFCTTVLNLALAQKGKMTERMFDFEQNGLAGLIPAFQRDAISPLAASEVFYHIGLINSAQRFVFEAQEAIPDFQKSSRCYKRLAETNLINGNYDVARKYLTTLQKTWYYREWATKTSALLNDDNAIGRHKEYGTLRQLKVNDSFFYSDRDMVNMLGKLFMTNKHNRLAFEYLETTCLLTCDLDMFVNCLGLNSEINYPVIPSIFQQAIMLWWARGHNASEGLPNGVRPDIAARFNGFATAIQSKPVNHDKLQSQFGKTYWYYYFTNKQQ